MKNIEATQENTKSPSARAKVCLASCRKLISNIERTKEAILTETRNTMGLPEHLLRLAMNEAEALAWETEYPHLVFPTLATEKAQAVAVWHSRQQSIERANYRPALAA